jgi:hypothetical protein
MSLSGVTQTLALRTAYRVAIAFVLLSLVCKSIFLNADEYVLDDSGQLIEMPLLVSGELTTPTLFVDVDGENCDFYEDGWCQRYGGNSSCIGLPSKQCWPRWFASASGLVMTRSLPDGVTSTKSVGVVSSPETNRGISISCPESSSTYSSAFRKIDLQTRLNRTNAIATRYAVRKAKVWVTPQSDMPYVCFLLYNWFNLKPL